MRLTEESKRSPPTPCMRPPVLPYREELKFQPVVQVVGGSAGIQACR